MTEISQEDKNTIDNFFDKLKDMATTGGEVTLNKIGDYVSKMPIGDLQNLGGLVKKYGHYGAFFAVQQSIEEHDLGPIGKYALGTGIAVLLIPASATITSATIGAFIIGSLVDLSWDYIEENKDDIFEKIKEQLAIVGIELNEDGLSVNYCPLSEYNINLLENAMWLIQEKYTTAHEQASPLVIDLDGDGIETNEENSTVHFDHDGNGFAESSGWVGKDDGLLVRDLNNNGQIDDGTELFGNNSVLSSGEKAANGFEALKDLDSNNDGVFNSSDTAWNQVKVWKDANSNGVVDEGELLTLEQANVSGINLDYENSTTTDENGNQHNQTGTFIKTDGSTGLVHDVWFDADYADTISKTEVTIPDNIKTLPEISGFGNVRSLQETMALDTSGELKTLIEQYIAETDATVRKGMINNIIFHWAGVEDIDPLSRKPSYFYDNPIRDARYLETLERFLGQKYSNSYWFGREDENPHEEASNYLLQAYDILAAYVSNELEAQTHCKTLLENIKLTWNEETQVWDIDISGAVNILNNLAETNTENAVYMLHNLEDIVKQQDIMTDSINTAFQNQAEEAGLLQMYYMNFGKFENKISNGNDIIYGTDDNNYINGLAGSDKIYGENGNDTLIGGTGDDYIVGGAGSDTYFFEGSWGHDSIDNSSTDEKGTNPDKILFGEGISPSDVTIQRRGNDLILSLHNGADTVTVYSYFLEAGTTTNTVDTIEFADGTVWNYEHIRVVWNAAPVSIGGFATISGTNGNDTINGTSGGDFLSGEKGDDIINANAGNDVIYGGIGNDALNGGNGDDTYIWNWGEGLDTIYDTGNNDTISFGDGITFNDLTFQCVNTDDLKIFVKNDPNQGVIIQDFLNGSLNYKIEELIFRDGSEVHLSEIALTLQQLSTGETITGTAFGDTIYAGGGFDTVNAGSGNDTIYGGSGNDYLNGGNGDDTYVYNVGDGLDTIYDYESSSSSGKNDKIKFGEGISATDVTLSRKDNNLVITLFNDITQGVIIQDFFYNSYYQIEKIEFSDGTIMDLTGGLTLRQADGNDNITGTSLDDVIYGNGGNDTLNGGNGNDTIIGGKDNDNLQGEYGNDTYVWNLGDGLDYISDNNGNNIIEFGEGITLENLTFERGNSNDSSNANNLYIFVNDDRNQGIIINYFFGLGTYRNFTLKFADGSTFVPKDNDFNFTLAEGVNTLYGFDYNDTLTGNNQENTISGGNGNDTLIGGKGNDTLKGEGGNDTYIWNLGDGFDYINDSNDNNIIEFGEGITLENLTFERSNENDSTYGYDLYIFVNGDRNQGLQLYYFFGSSSYQNFTLKFADGSTTPLTTDISLSQLPEVNLTLNGTADDDILTGGTGHDIINAGDGYNDITGGQGNDTITGGYDRDTYYYNLGDGFDTITDPNGKDQIIFGEGISKDDLTLRRNGNDLWLIINDDLTQGMKLVNFFASDDNKIETLKFSDNSSINLATAGLTLDQWDTDDNITGTSYDDIIYGNDGKDTLSGGSGKDILIGGHGNDTLYGGAGNDTYRWNSGDDFDTIEDNSGQNSVEFGDGIDFDDLTFTKIGENLYITINDNPTEGLNLSKFFNSDGYKNFTLKFKDGTQYILNENGLTFSQGDTFDTINGTNFNDVIYANDGNDTVNTLAGNDTVYGGKGNDVIDAGNGNDTLTGGEGNDSLTGGAGDDTYIYNLGDGFDTISDADGTDKIILGTGITADMLSFSREGNDLRIIISNDKLQGFLLKNQFAAGTSKIESIEFSNNSTLSLINKGFTFNQNNIDETISGTDFNDTINAAAGNDTVNAGEGDDTITGGLGNDNLNGGNGDDTYIYNIGDGLDTITETSGADKIILGNSISPENLRFIREGNNLRILINNNVDQGFLLVNQFAGADTRIEQLQFADNSVLDLVNDSLTFEQYDGGETINGTDNDDIIYGKGGNDTINAGDGDDTIIGGTGDDTLSGGYGRDTYIYNLGDGADIINEARGNDKIKFGTGITQDDLTFVQEGNNLRILIGNDPYQNILINNFYSNVNNQIETLQFADGSSFNLSTQGLTLQQTNADDTVNGTSYNDVIYGNGGHDTINAGEGNDTIIGGIGNDTLNGGAGNDTYQYNLGDGFDTISETGGTDKIVFGEGITQNNLSFEQIGNNLKISINGDEIKGLQINNHFSSSANQVESIEFADGTTLDLTNADQLIQAMNSFGAGTSSTMDVLSNPTENVSDMYNLASGSDLIKKAI